MNPHGLILPLRIVGVFIFLGGLLPLGIGCWVYFEAREFRATASSASGKVIELVPAASTNGSTTYSAVFEFTDTGGTAHRCTSKWSSNPPGYAVGQAVEILYDPTDPIDARAGDSKAGWVVPLILGFVTAVDWGLAVVFLWFIPMVIRRVWPPAPNPTRVTPQR